RPDRPGGPGPSTELGHVRHVRLFHRPLRDGNRRMAEAAASGDRTRFRSGVIFGKFYPLTRGHQYLIETALARCDRVTICVSHRPSETIPVAVRRGWITT